MKNRNLRPPRFAKWLLYRMKSYQEEHSIAGDVEEVFCQICREKGHLRAYLWYWYQCLVSSNRYLLYNLNRSRGMIRNYLRSAYRYLIRQKLYFVINTTGLALGLACCILIYLYVSDELSFDNFHENNNDLYQVQKVYFNDSDGSIRNKQSTVQPGLGALLPGYFPEIKYQSRIDSYVNVVSYKDVSFRDRITIVDTHFFEMFSFKMISGTPESVIRSDNSIVFTRAYAEKYFRDEEPVGKTVTILTGQESKDFIITGIVENVPENSTLQFNIVVNCSNMSFLTSVKDADKILYSHWFDTYVQLKPGSSPEEFNEKSHAFTSQYFAEYIQADRDKGRWTREGNPYSFGLQPMKNVHFDLADGGNSNLTAVYILGIIALAVLIIACINFVNLSIGMS
ncbi:MAG: hypothetical protein GY863_00585, partial [bacterium]|nr:hypothetical protein [bacterium]